MPPALPNSPPGWKPICPKVSPSSPCHSPTDRREEEVVTHYATSAPNRSPRMETNLPQGFAVFSLPLAHQLRLRTNNALERVNQELKRRTRVASLFPNEASLLRLVTALLNELSDEWQTTKVYLTMENHPQPSV